MPRKIRTREGRTFTYLTPQEKADKYELELAVGFKVAYAQNKDGTFSIKDKFAKGRKSQELTNFQRKYREDYIQAYNQSKSKGFNDFYRDFSNFKNR